LPGTSKQTNWENVPGWHSDQPASDSGVETGWYPTDGDWTGFIMDSDPTVWNLTNYTIAAGDEFTLKVDAQNNFGADTFRASLYYDDPCGRVEVATQDYPISAAGEGAKEEMTLSFSALDVPASVGHKIGIEFDNATSGGSWLGMDNVRLDVIPAVRATNVYPTDGAEYVPVTAVLEWAAPLLYVPVYYDVYRSITDANANLPRDMVLEHANQLTYDDPCNMEFEETYYWRVVSYEAFDVNYPGDPWTFTTAPEIPVFSTHPEHTIVAETESAVFSAVSPNADSFQWYKAPSTLLSHGGDISIVSDATTSTLTIANVNQAADEAFYYCKATNAFDNTDSTHAKLAVEDLLAHWKMDGPLLSGLYYKDETGNHHADPNKPSEVSFTPGIIVNAVQMNNFRWADAGSWRPDEYGGQMTVSAWIKVDDTNDIAGDGQGIVSKRDSSVDWALYVRHGDGGHPGNNYVRFSSHNNGDVWAGPDAVDPENAWVFVAATVDGAGVARLYINGALQAVDDAWSYGDYVEDPNILIGKGTPTNTNFVFPGLIDDVKIYNYARDSYEIAADYTDEVGGSVCAEDIPGDYNGDCKYDLTDVAELAMIWRNCNIIPASACP
jgi:hypothetical protein